MPEDAFARLRRLHEISRVAALLEHWEERSAILEYDGSLSRVDAERRAFTLLTEEDGMAQNVVALVGILERRATIQEGEGPVTGRATLKIDERGRDGRTYTLFVPLELYGQLASQASSWEPGQLLAISGALKWRSYTDRSGEKKSQLCVFTKEAHRLDAALADLVPG